MAVIGAVFGAFLLSLSVVSGIVGLTAGFVGIRMAGQGALALLVMRDRPEQLGQVPDGVRRHDTVEQPAWGSRAHRRCVRRGSGW